MALSRFISPRSSLAIGGRALELLWIVGFYFLIVVFWQALAMSFEPELSPAKIARTMWLSYPTAEFLSSVLSTLKRIALGFTIAMIGGVLAGILLGLFRSLNDIFDPLWSLLRPIAPLAWVPITIVWFGIGESAAIAVIAFTVFFPIMLGTLQGVRDASPIYREAALTFGANPWILIREVILPAALPAILASLRVGLALAFSVIIAAELVIGFALHSGLGYLMVKYTQITFSLSELMAVVFAVGVLGLAADQLLVRLMDWLAPWRSGARAR